MIGAVQLVVIGSKDANRVVQLVGLLTVLSLAPSIVIMTTSFVRIVVKSFFRASARSAPALTIYDPAS